MLQSQENKASMIRPIVHQIAEEYPQTLWNPFNFLNKNLKNQNAKLSELLTLPEYVQNINHEIKKVSMPDIRTKTLIESISHIDDSEKLEDLWQDFQEMNFSKQTNAEKRFFAGKSFTDRLKEFGSKCHQMDKKQKENMATDFKNELHNMNFFNVTLLSDLSPSLNAFIRSSGQQTMEIPKVIFFKILMK